MAMYVELLSAGFNSGEPTVTGPEDLLTLARAHRGAMFTAVGRRHLSAERSLAYDVVYDTALIRLCGAVGIEATPALFGQPREERARLEHALAEAGMDLTDPDLADPPGAGRRTPPPRCDWSS
jgi:hypothetical protein